LKRIYKVINEKRMT